MSYTCDVINADTESGATAGRPGNTLLKGDRSSHHRHPFLAETPHDVDFWRPSRCAGEVGRRDIKYLSRARATAVWRCMAPTRDPSSTPTTSRDACLHTHTHHVIYL